MQGGMLVACVLALPVVGCAMDDGEVIACARRRGAPVISSDEPLTVDVSGEGCHDAAVTCVSRVSEGGPCTGFQLRPVRAASCFVVVTSASGAKVSRTMRFREGQDECGGGNTVVWAAPDVESEWRVFAPGAP